MGLLHSAANTGAKLVIENGPDKVWFLHRQVDTDLTLHLQGGPVQSTGHRNYKREFDALFFGEVECHHTKTCGSVVLGKYSGCLGAPDLVTPKQYRL